LRILKCFTDETPVLRVGDVSAKLDLTPSLVSRLLATLEHEGMVERDEETGFYRLGRAIVTLAGVSLNTNRLRVEALTEMQAVANRLGLGVNMAVLDGDAIFYLAHVDGPHAPRPYTLIGRHNPLHATGMGKLLLAFLPDAERTAYLEGLPLPAYTSHSITDRQRLREELDTIRARGWAVELEELALGRGCVAGPIRDKHGRVVAAISISGPISTLDWEARRAELISAIIEVADRISMRMGYLTAPRPRNGGWRPGVPAERKRTGAKP
jgi:DNA-binding IclR family transcriptional regulator